MGPFDATQSDTQNLQVQDASTVPNPFDPGTPLPAQSPTRITIPMTMPGVAPQAGTPGGTGGQGPTPQPSGTPVATPDDLAELDRQEQEIKAQQAPQGANTEGAPVEQATPQDDAAEMDKQDKAIIRSSAASDKRMGNFLNVAQGLNMSLLTAMRPLESIGAAASMGAGAQEAALSGNDKLEADLEQLGTEYLNDPQKAYIPAEEFFYKMGFRAPPDTYATDAGKLLWSTIATSLATLYGVGAVAKANAARGIGDVAGTNLKGAVSQAIALAARKYSDAVAANPGLFLSGELLSGMGSTIGGESAQDYATAHGASQGTRAAANISGSIAGGLMGGTAGFLTFKVGNATQRVSKWFMNKLALAADEIASHFGMSDKNLLRNQPDIQKSIGIKGTAPLINEDDVDAAREAEKAARQAGDNVVAARKQLDQAIPGSAEHISAKYAMTAAQENERQTVAIADAAWNKLPKEVRGKYSRQQAAIRAKFADTVYPKEFAENQVQDELSLVNAQVNNVMNDLSPSERALGMSGQSAKLSEGLWKAWDIAKGIQSKYWTRAPLRKAMPDSSILKSIDGPTGLLTKWRADGIQQNQMPLDEIASLRERFAPNSIRQQGRPTLGWMKNFMTDLKEKEAQLYASGNRMLAGAYAQLHNMMQSKISEAFPENVPLQQARAFTQKFNDFFSRGDLGRFMRTNKERGTRINPEDVGEQLMRTNHGFRDIVSLVQWLGSNGARLTNIEEPMYLSEGQRMALGKLKDDASQTIRQYAQQYFDQTQADPVKAQRMLSNAGFQRKIQALGDVAGEVRAAASELSDLVARRTTIEKSALAKYMQRDPDKALDMVWGASNPSAIAKELMEGTPGVGGFRDDPKAMQGFTAGLIDRLVSSTGGDPTEMLSLLAGPRGRLLKDVMGNSAYNRLEELVKRSQMVGAQEAQQSLGHKFKVKLIQMASLKALHLLPEWTQFGEGGQLQRAALVSSFAEDVAETMMSTMPISERFKMALSNPAVEEALYSNLPQSREEAKSLTMTLNRAIMFEHSIEGAYINWSAYGNGPVREGVTDPSDSPLWWFTPGQAQAARTEGGQPYEESANRFLMRRKMAPHYDQLSR